MPRTILFTTALLSALAARATASDPPPNPTSHEPFSPPAVKDADAFIQARLKDGWLESERKTWRIDYRPITGLSDRSSWHIVGTHWWVQLYPEHYKLDELDKSTVYEFDAVALNQNYGVIDFYVYRRPRPVKP